MSATVLGGFFETAEVPTLSTAHTRSALKRRAAFALSRKQALASQELLLTLDGVIAGSAASKTLSRVEANAELSGVRTIETETLVSRVTVAGDVTDLNADILTYTSYDSTPIANGDGNPLGGAH